MPNRAELPESRSRLVALALTVLLASAPAATRADRTGDLLRELEVLRAERMELELALERLKRQVPMAAELEHLEARVRRAAEVGTIVGADVVELAPIPGFHVYDYTAAALAAKIMNYALAGTGPR